MYIKRFENNPILKPNRHNYWEAGAVFNACPIKKGKNIHLLYRAISSPRYVAPIHQKMPISEIGIASGQDGRNFSDRRPFIKPDTSWDRFGCEDPRITKLGSEYLITYTALSEFPFTAEGIKVGLAISKDLKTINSKHLVTPFNAKAMAIFPSKINGRVWAILTVHSDKPPSQICLASFNKVSDIWSKSYWRKWYKNFPDHALSLQRRPEDHVEIGAPPIKTDKGWLLIYSYIQNYLSHNTVFGVEAVLLDLKDPSQIIARTKYPFLVPEEYYEKIGIVPNIVFPSGALLEGDEIYLYYGGADTVCCLATIKTKPLLDRMLGVIKPSMFIRVKNNPIMEPIKSNKWESKAVFNPAAIYLENKVHLVYRAMSEDNTSVLGYAASSDGSHIDYRHPDPIYIPRAEFEQKKEPNGNSGCEDPRLTKIGDKLYMLYTAFDGKSAPRVAMSFIKIKDFLSRRWHWSKPILISPPGLDDKDAFIFPEKVNGRFMIVHRLGNNIDYAFSSALDFKGHTWIDEHDWIMSRPGMWDSRKTGSAAPPIKTKDGYILLYHGVSHSGTYRVGAVLLDLKNPTKIIARTEEPIFSPDIGYEQEGQISNVVFPGGAVAIKDEIFIYYGGADSVVGAAKIKTADLLKYLKFCKS